jgi:hypothetical protein
MCKYANGVTYRKESLYWRKQLAASLVSRLTFHDFYKILQFPKKEKAMESIALHCSCIG